MKKIFFGVSLLVFWCVLFFSSRENNIFNTSNSKWQLNVDNKIYPRIFCMILTHSGNLKTRARAVEDAWATKCDKYKFIAVIPNE